jgi:hypothetical protein
MRAAPRLLSALRRVEEVARNDGEFRYVCALPRALGIWTRDPLSAIRIFDHSNLVPDKAADIEFVLDLNKQSVSPPRGRAWNANGNMQRGTGILWMSESALVLPGFTIKPNVVTSGNSSRNNCSRFATTVLVNRVTPLRLPPGRFKLATSPN